MNQHVVHHFAASHPLLQALDSRHAEDFKRLETCTEFARALSKFEWEGYGYESIGRLVAVVSKTAMAGGVCVEIYRRPKNFSRMTEHAQLNSTRRMERVKVRFFADNPQVLALAQAMTEIGVHFGRVTEHGND